VRQASGLPPVWQPRRPRPCPQMLNSVSFRHDPDKLIVEDRLGHEYRRENVGESKPIHTSVTANPFTGPSPNKKRNAHDTTVVTCVSTMVHQALLKPGIPRRRSPPCRPAAPRGCARISGRWNPTAIPMVRMDAGDPRQRQHRLEVGEPRHQHTAVFRTSAKDGVDTPTACSRPASTVTTASNPANARHDLPG